MGPNKKEARKNAAIMIINELVGAGMATKKVCSMCGEEKFLKDFSLDSKRKDGRKEGCIECAAKSTEERKKISDTICPLIADTTITEEVKVIGHDIVEDNISLKTKKEIVVLYGKGAQPDEIASKLGVPKDTVIRAIYGA